MEDERGEQAEPAAAPGVGVFRKLFDFNTFFESDGSKWFLWLIARLALLGIGNVTGGVFWELVSAEAADDRWFGERFISNTYLWASLIATGLCALYDRRVQRQRTAVD